MVRKFSLISVITAICLFSVSCFHIRYSSTGGSMPEGVNTFSVQFVENQARIVEPGLSQQVTNELKDYIRNNARNRNGKSLVMVNTTGDIDFEAVITGYEPSTPTTVVAGDEAAQNKFTITIKVKYTCNVDPELDFETSFSRFKVYNVSSGFENVKQELTKEILDEIYEDIYKRAFVNW